MIVRLLVGLTVLGGAALGTLAYRGREAEADREGQPLPARPDGLAAGPAVLVFTSPLCLACRRTPGLVAEALDTDEASLRAGEAPVALAEVDVREDGELTEALDVTRTPTIVGVSSEDRVAFSHEANPDPGELAREIEALVEGER